MVYNSHVFTWFSMFCIIWYSANSIKNTNNNHHMCTSNFDYSDALSKGILFFEGQRSGKLPANQRVMWRADSALSDGKLENVDLSEGYYDAGDNVKFGWPMAFSVGLLSWAAVEYENELQSAHQLSNLQMSIRWGTDFLLKAHTSSTTFYTQGPRVLGAAEDMDTPRTLYKVTPTSPGTEAAAEAAAALAAASIVFRAADSNYSATLITNSKSLFEFADKYRGSYQGSCPFYCSFSGYQDELIWAAAWLYRASGNDTYLNYVSTNKDWSQAVNEFSWDNKFAGAQILLEYLAGKITLSTYKTGADSFVCALMPESSSVQIRTTPGGLLYTRDSSNLQYVTSATMLLLVYSKILTEARLDGVRCGSVNFSPTDIKAFAKSQVDYILGANPLNMSYMVGFGAKYPTQLHHRGASIPSIRNHPAKVGCSDGLSAWYNFPNPNPNTHVGAVVGGPGPNDQFTDSRTDFSHLEPTTYMNAAFVGSVAALIGQTRPECPHLDLHHNNINRSNAVEF
ncbi:endoglucanase [Striga asiatica]|uniref:Endoglucanase n=1 Tax=Striga asiatica TaxID=4170 RepID=A0A5A7PJU4_STRAF|nr:endoglucanase [Striga asiatica]